MTKPYELDDRTVLFRSGSVRVSSADTDDLERRLSEITGQFLQVHNLVLFLGAGTTFHLGSPKIRAVSRQDVVDLIKDADLSIPPDVDPLLDALIGSSADLEELLATLSAAIVYADRTSAEEIVIGSQKVTVESIVKARRLLNRGLAHACDLPGSNSEITDPWRIHTEFFRRLLRSRRQDLPRCRVFTTNYDLAIERSLDASGITCVDGFVGSIERIFRPETYSRDLYQVPRPGERRLLRVPELVYLYKIHGSISWQARPSAKGGAILQVDPSRREDSELALIYPTPQKENDVLGYPYSELLRRFASTLAEPETAVLIAGYSFADEHINRLLFQALSSNATLQILVLEPFGLLDPESGVLSESAGDRVAGRFAQATDARIAVLTGPLARFEDFATSVMPDPDETGEAETDDNQYFEFLLKE